MGHVNTADLRKAANTVAGVAGVVRQNIPTEVGQVAGALPGSTSGPAATTLATTWTNSYNAWASSTEQHAQSMRDAADGWDKVDGETATGFTGTSSTTTPSNISFSTGMPYGVPFGSQTQGGPTGGMRFVNGGMEAV